VGFAQLTRDRMENAFEELRQREFSRLDAEESVYLDYAGSGLYPESLLRAHTNYLAKDVLGNPHSLNPTSTVSTHNLNITRNRISQFFEADQNEYCVIFTLNATHALKLVGESYPFQPNSRLILTADNHNSVNGIREFAKMKGVKAEFVPLDSELRIENIDQFLPHADRSIANLFAYPAQSNFSGVKHSLSWIKEAQSKGYDVLLDAAAFVPTNRLSLKDYKPDFVCVSFYKMFGFPTGVGALLARRAAIEKLRRPWFSGGTVRFVSTQNDVYLLTTTSEAFEDGTPNFLGIPAIINGLDFLDRIGMERINSHVSKLTQLLLGGLQSIKHNNGNSLVKIYGPSTTRDRGATVAFGLLDTDGREVDYKLVEGRANDEKISIRTGCFCNPGAAEFAFGYTATQSRNCFDLVSNEFSLEKFSECMKGRPVGALRASLGIASNQADVQRLIQMLKSFLEFKCPTPEQPLSLTTGCGR
jgi:selenocysteine lyase/cysteine desulfurase